MKNHIIIFLAFLFLLTTTLLDARVQTLFAQELFNPNLLEPARNHHDPSRYPGARGKVITAFDDVTERWIKELQSETIEAILQKLNDAAEITGFIATSSDIHSIYHNEEWRERCYHSISAEALLSSRRFRKVYEDLQKMNKTKAAELLSKNIRENLTALRGFLQEDYDRVAKGEHTNNIPITYSICIPNAYRPMSTTYYPPTRYGRKYGTFAYIWLAALLEIKEVRPAVEEFIDFAREEYAFFNSIDQKEAPFFKVSLLKQSVYNPSLLVTAAHTDPEWNVEKKRALVGKRVNRTVVDYQARALEHDKFARDGWIPSEPHHKMLNVRYYRGITDEEFNYFFGE